MKISDIFKRSREFKEDYENINNGEKKVTVYDAAGNFIGNYGRIQVGIKACPEGGTVSVAPGTYIEKLRINKRIILVGVDTPTIRDLGGREVAIVTFDGKKACKASISGFRITEAIVAKLGLGLGAFLVSGSAIYCINGAEPIITNNIISANRVNGICCFNSSPTIENNTISRNDKYGIYCALCSVLSNHYKQHDI